mmetsp:Transcript_95585/g.199821  ORF Transcript_95585/g.199821 Transcript_95585/m.199821 type:complete len:212 (+) Transcript_95585:401-1036(+)
MTVPTSNILQLLHDLHAAAGGPSVVLGRLALVVFQVQHRPALALRQPKQGVAQSSLRCEMQRRLPQRVHGVDVRMSSREALANSSGGCEKQWGLTMLVGDVDVCVGGEKSLTNEVVSIKRSSVERTYTLVISRVRRSIGLEQQLHKVQRSTINSSCEWRSGPRPPVHRGALCERILQVLQGAIDQLRIFALLGQNGFGQLEQVDAFHGGAL